MHPLWWGGGNLVDVCAVPEEGNVIIFLGVYDEAMLVKAQMFHIFLWVGTGDYHDEVAEGIWKALQDSVHEVLKGLASFAETEQHL